MLFTCHLGDAGDAGFEFAQTLRVDVEPPLVVAQGVAGFLELDLGVAEEFEGFGQFVVVFEEIVQCGID